MEREIVGAKIGSMITNSPRIIIWALENEKKVEFLTRELVKLMADFDLGHNWTKMANSPVLFIQEVDDNGKTVGVHDPRKE